jgi:hypothetical protein
MACIRFLAKKSLTLLIAFICSSLICPARLKLYSSALDLASAAAASTGPTRAAAKRESISS